jgi:transposase
MRFVPVKSAESQAALLDHKTRDFLVRQRTQIINAIRAHMGEFGIVVAKVIQNIDHLLAAAQDVPTAARPALNSSKARKSGSMRSRRGSQRNRPMTRSHAVWLRCRGWVRSPPALLPRQRPT